MAAANLANGVLERQEAGRYPYPDMPAAPKIKAMIVDDHRTFAEALRISMELERDITVVGVAVNGEEARALAEEHQPDVVLMDMEMPGMDGIEAIRRLKEVSPDSRVVVVSAHQGDTILGRAVEAGASGYLSKETALSTIVESVRQANQGESLLPPEEMQRVLRHLRHRRVQEASGRQRADRLTKRETEILQLMADGVGMEDIATVLSLKPATLRTHVQNILTKLGVHSKLEALAFAIRHGKVTT